MFFREVDPMILRANSNSMQTADALREAVAVTTMPQGLARRHVVRFNGEPRAAAARASQVVAARRNDDGSRLELNIRTPNNDIDRLYDDADANGHSIKTSQLTRTLEEVFAVALPKKTITANRKAGLVSIDYKVAAKIVVKDAATFQAEFKEETLTEIGISEMTIQQAFSSVTLAAGGTWSF